jgi:hypothetical protein
MEGIKRLSMPRGGKLVETVTDMNVDWTLKIERCIAAITG